MWLNVIYMALFESVKNLICRIFCINASNWLFLLSRVKRIKHDLQTNTVLFISQYLDNASNNESPTTVYLTPVIIPLTSLSYRPR